MFNFDIKKTEIFWVAKTEKSPLFRFAGFFKRLFFYLFIASLVFFAFAFLGLLSENLAAKALVFSFTAWLLFWELYLFLEFKIKKPDLKTDIAAVALSPDNYNLAEFLSLDALKIVEDAIKFCKKIKISEI